MAARRSTPSAPIAGSARAMWIWLLSSSALLVALSVVEGLILPSPPAFVGSRVASTRNTVAPPTALFSVPPHQSAAPFEQDRNVYVPQSELENAIQKEQERHAKECHELHQTIEQQREELQQLKENEHKERLKHKMYNDACSADNLQMLWSENHSEKMKRSQVRLEYLTDENLHLQSKLEQERQRHELEIRALQTKLEREKEKTQEAKDVLGLERAYYETSVTLLEKGLEREGRKVQALQSKLKEQKLRMDRRQGRILDEPLPQRNINVQEQQPTIAQQYLHQEQPQQEQPREQEEKQEEEHVYETYHYNEHRHDRETEPDRHDERRHFDTFGQFHEPHSFQPRQRQRQQQQSRHSDQYGFEHPYRHDEFHPGAEGRPYYRRQRSESSNERRYARATSSYHHRRNPSTAASSSSRSGRTRIPTMNGPHLGGGGINDMRNRLY